MKFERFFSTSIFNKKENKKQVSFIIILITQIAVILGILVAQITFAVGLGAKKEIKEKLSDFSSHIVIKKFNEDSSLDSSAIDLEKDFHPNYLDFQEIAQLSPFAIKSGILRTEKEIEGILFKGISKKYDFAKLEKFLFDGKIPDFSKKNPSNEILLSRKMADLLNLNVGSKINAFFSTQEKRDLKARNFIISGLYETGIKNFDDHFIIGDLRQIQKINNWNENQVGGFEIFLKNPENLEEIKKKIKEKLPSDLEVNSLFSRFDSIISWIKIFDFNILIIICIIALVVMINMVILLLILILERFFTLGILKILGASNSSINLIFFFYGLKIMLPSLFIGNLIALSFLISQKYFHWIGLDPANYYLTYIPIYLNFYMILLINLIYFGLCLLIMALPSFFISKYLPIKMIKFD